VTEPSDWGPQGAVGELILYWGASWRTDGGPKAFSAAAISVDTCWKPAMPE
jgi:hypothetical protein